MKRKVITTMMACALSAAMVVPAFATTGDVIPVANGTEVWAGIMLKDPDAKIKVEVPTLFAFVVNGTVDTTATGALEAGDILLPNVKVEVTTPSGTAGTDPVYQIQTVGETAMKFTNYSTKKDDGNGAAATDRLGLEVKLQGSIKNEGDEKSRNYWTHVANAGDASMQGEEVGFKKYTLNVDGQAFDVAKDGGFTMATPMTLAAPNLGKTASGYTNLDTTTNLAISGETKVVPLDVKIGGQKKQYNQVEESAKVGTIVWTVSASVTDPTVTTAPDEDFLPSVPPTVAP